MEKLALRREKNDTASQESLSGRIEQKTVSELGAAAEQPECPVAEIQRWPSTSLRLQEEIAGAAAAGASQGAADIQYKAAEREGAHRDAGGARPPRKPSWPKTGKGDKSLLREVVERGRHRRNRRALDRDPRRASGTDLEMRKTVAAVGAAARPRVGQNEVVTAVADAILRSRAGLSDPNRPIAVPVSSHRRGQDGAGPRAGGRALRQDAPSYGSICPSTWKSTP